MCSERGLSKASAVEMKPTGPFANNVRSRSYVYLSVLAYIEYSGRFVINHTSSSNSSMAPIRQTLLRPKI